MKKTIIAATALSAIVAQAGNFTSYDYGSFKLHLYNSGDAMGDASYIVEGKKELVVLEVPLFKENAREFDTYVAKLGKPVVAAIADYHEGARQNAKLYVAEGMKSFFVGPIYGGMMNGFHKQWGESIVALPDLASATEIGFGKTVKLAGVDFKFEKGASSDFPAASVLIGGDAYLTHWAPAKAHVSPLQISSLAAIDAEILAAKASLASGAELFLGGHGGAADKESVEFKIAYLENLKSLAEKFHDAETLADAIEKAYPGLAGKSNVEGLAAALTRK